MSMENPPFIDIQMMFPESSMKFEDFPCQEGEQRMRGRSEKSEGYLVIRGVSQLERPQQQGPTQEIFTGYPLVI